MSAALDNITPETADALTDWIELESGKRARLAFIPAGRWSSILGRDTSLRKGMAAIESRLEDGTSADPVADAAKLGKFKEGVLQVAGEVVGFSLREIEGREPLRLEGDALHADDLEALALDGIFWEAYSAIVQAHLVDADQARALFRSGLG